MHVQMVQPPETFVFLGTLASAAKIVPTHYFVVKSIHHFHMMMSHVHLVSLIMPLIILSFSEPWKCYTHKMAHSDIHIDLTLAVDKYGPSLRTPYGVMKCYLGFGEAKAALGIP